VTYDHWKTTEPDPFDDEWEQYRLSQKYAHIGCPAARFEDNCPHPGDCAEYGCCIQLENQTLNSPDRTDGKPEGGLS